MTYLDTLNKQQREAVEHTDGPLLILAGAGSGKTRVLTCRIARLIDTCGVAPWNIMAITFTNKAAGEMRERVDQLVGHGSESIWVSTFHSSCCRILRRFIDRIGYDTSFTIYDTDDSRQVMKEIIRALELDPRVYKERALLAKISAAKNNMLTPDDMEKDAFRWEQKQMIRVWRAYEERMRKNNALDFDDLLVLTVRLFRECPDVLEYWQERFRYILIDEYQDTNTVQFAFVKALASRRRNLCVVGDDDQSIYKFRGANIRNILDFEEAFPGARVIRLEQNYRSTQNILNAANEVIRNNSGRKEKTLWTDNGDGEKVRFRQFPTGFDEASFVADEIARRYRQEGCGWRSYAVLYRTNAQSRLFEEKMISAGIPYKIVGGVNFYARKEIKDMLAYLKTVDNGRDDLAVERIINVPKRGIGGTSLARVRQYAYENGMTFYEALENADRISGISRAQAGIRRFTSLIGRLRASAEYLDVDKLIGMIISETGYADELRAEGTDEANARIENLDELISKAADFKNGYTGDPDLYPENRETLAAGSAGTVSPEQVIVLSDSLSLPDGGGREKLSDFLQQVSLVADIDTVDPDSDYVLLMTLHSAKGLEFDSVYLTGMEENTFPSYMAINSAYREDEDDESDNEEIEEERRLCYVGITRARKHLTLTAAQMRMVRGEPQFLKASRFVREIPREYIELERETSDVRSFMKPPEIDPDRILGLGRGGRNYDREAMDGSRGFGSQGSAGQMSAYRDSLKKAAGRKPFSMKQFTVRKADHLDYAEGDRVRHVKFGEGTVTGIRDGGKDYEVTVDFEKYGTKRMFASFAKLERVQG